jgi:hypothetical protein
MMKIGCSIQNKKSGQFICRHGTCWQMGLLVKERLSSWLRFKERRCCWLQNLCSMALFFLLLNL